MLIFWVGDIHPATKTSIIFQNDEIASISTGLGDSFTLRVKELLNSFIPELANPWTSLPPKQGELDHHIDLTGSVLTKRQRISRLSPAEKEESVRQ